MKEFADDKIIVELFWKRDENALIFVSDKYTKLCYGIAWNLLSDHMESEECVNDTWYASWRRIPPYKPFKLPAFLTKITRGFALDKLRKRYAQKRISNKTIELLDEVESLNNIIIDENWIDNNIRLHEIIEEFLEALSPKNREIFLRRYWFFDSIKEIAEAFGISEGSVKQSLFRSRRKLEEVLREERYIK